MNCELGCDPSLSERFSIFRQKVDIEQKLLSNSEKTSSIVGNLDIKVIY